jgi:hypothetical protein
MSLLDGERPRCGLDEERDVSPTRDGSKGRTRVGGWVNVPWFGTI